MLNCKFFMACLLLTSFYHMSNGSRNFFDEMAESNDSAYLSFEKFLEKTSIVNRLRKNIEHELTFLAQSLPFNKESEVSRMLVKKISGKYAQLDTDLEAFIPNHELLEELNSAFSNMETKGDHINMSHGFDKRSNRQVFLKQFYHSKVPVIRNGRK